MDCVFSITLMLSLASFLLIGRISFLKPWSSMLLNSSFFLIVFSGVSNIPFQSFKSHDLFQLMLSALIGLIAASLLLVLKKKSEALKTH